MRESHCSRWQPYLSISWVMAGKGFAGTGGCTNRSYTSCRASCSLQHACKFFLVLRESEQLGLCPRAEVWTHWGLHQQIINLLKSLMQPATGIH